MMAARFSRSFSSFSVMMIPQKWICAARSRGPRLAGFVRIVAPALELLTQTPSGHAARRQNCEKETSELAQSYAAETGGIPDAAESEQGDFVGRGAAECGDVLVAVDLVCGAGRDGV